jgi:YajG family uncharacterized lipoprotein
MSGHRSVYRAVELAGMFVLALTLGACYQNREVALSQPTTSSSVAPAGLGKAITVVRPHDARANPGTIGGLRGAAVLFTDPSVPAAVAHPQTDVAGWIGNALVSGLEHAGFRVERAETVAQSPTPLAILITVNQAYVTFTAAFLAGYSGEARVAVAVQAYRAEQPIFRRSYSGVSTATSIGDSGGPSANDYQQALQNALQKLLDQAIPNLAEALAREQS